MSFVTPKLVFNPVTNTDAPVWEITTATGAKIYYERKQRPGLIAVGNKGHCNVGSALVTVHDVVTPPQQGIRILLEQDGFVAPDAWYCPEENPDWSVALADEPGAPINDCDDVDGFDFSPANAVVLALPPDNLAEFGLSFAYRR